MPRDLFEPSIVTQATLGRRAGLVPLSVAMHVVVIGAAVLIPALAVGALPDPRASLTYVAHEVLLPAVPVGTTAPATRPRAMRGAPLTAPSTLPPLDAEPPANVSMDTGPIVDGGLPPGDGFGIPGGGETGPLVLPEPPPAPPRVLRVGGDIRPPVKIRDVRPVYPEIARSARVQGMVIIEATIDETGHVANARLLRSIPLLDEAALTAVRQWIFTPTRLNGEPTSVIMTVTVQFTLQ
jgi:protein TonB